MVLDWVRHHYSVSVVAHRGYNAKYPENTLLAFEKAIEVGADYIELDIDFSKDGHIVVIHDDYTGRVANKNIKVTESTLKELKQLDSGSSQTIPTLIEVLDLCEGKIGINIEIKGKNMAKSLNELLKSYKMDDDLIISSFRHQRIIDFRKINQTIKIAALEPVTSNILKKLSLSLKSGSILQNATKIGVDAIHPFTLMVTKKFIAKAHAQNLAVNTWTSDNRTQWKKFVEFGIDGIITNNPEKLIEYLKLLQ